MNKVSPPLLLLVDPDERLRSRFIRVSGPSCSVAPFQTADDAAGWLNEGQTVDLVVTDQRSGQRLVALTRMNPRHQFMPVLITCLSADVNGLANDPLLTATDLLPIDQDDHALQSALQYYLSLTTISSAGSTPTPSPGVQPFRLPLWKRLIDISVAVPVLLLLFPPMLLVALLIRLDSRGPVFYRSKRAGANYAVFSMYKYRTMTVRADQRLNELSLSNVYAKPTDPTADNGAPDSPHAYRCTPCRQRGVACQQPLFDQDQPICEKLYLQENEEIAKFMKFRNDPRITRFGRFLRNSSIDELPQLVNVLLGDMSLVGNRPLPLYEAETLTIDESAKRFAGPAGLTGIWQTKKRARGQGPMSDRERILLDIEYAGTFSFRTDMAIIWKTFFSLWQQENV